MRRITRTLVRAGVLVEDPEQPWLDLEAGSPLEQLAAAAVRYRITVGPLAGRKTMTLHSASAVARDGVTVKALTAARDGFSLNAAVVCEAHQREKLERLQPHYNIFRTCTVAFGGNNHARCASLAWRDRGRVAYTGRPGGLYRA